MQFLVTLFFVAVALQTVYFIFFLVAFLRAHTSSGVSSAPVSVVICAHDEETNLRDLIPLLAGQEHPDFEVIIVDDRSNDATHELLLECTAKDSRFKKVSIDKTPDRFNAKKYALTLGIKVARHELILFTDADCRPNGKHWISRMAACFDEKTSIVLGYSPYFCTKGLLNGFIRFDSLITAVQYAGYALLGVPYMGVGRNLAYRKSLFIDNKGFHNLIEVTGGDDDLFVNRHARARNTQVCMGADAVMFSIPKKTWRSFFQQKVRHLAVGKRYKGGHRVMLGLFVMSLIITWFAAVPLLFLEAWYLPVAVALLWRVVLEMIVLHVAGKKLGDKFNVWGVVFLDFLYSIYYISTGLVALLTKKVQWRS